MKNHPLFEYYTKFEIPTRLAEDISSDEMSPIEYIDNTSKVNLFVGVNNSGKSLLLRELLKSKTFNEYPGEKIKAEITEFIKTRLDSLELILVKNDYQRILVNHRTYIDIGKIQKSNVPFDSKFQTISEYKSKGLSDLYRICTIKPIRFRPNDRLSSHVPFPQHIQKEIHRILEELRNLCEKLSETYTNKEELNKVYILDLLSIVDTKIG